MNEPAAKDNPAGLPPQRKLIWVPIVHSVADFGSLAEAVEREHVRRHGRAAWERHTAAVNALWRGIRAAIDNLRLAPARLRLYQDGLPDAGHEAEVVRSLAEAGSPNHKILAELIARGARLTGTESPELLREEYELARQSLAGPGAATERARELLGRRDRYIAGRVDETLRPDETGLLFLGVLHSLDGLLPADVTLTRLRYAVPPARAGA